MRAKIRAASGCILVAAGALLGGCDWDSSSGSSGAVAAAASSAGPAEAEQTTSVTISWLPPDTNDNGSALTDLAGYHIHYGTSSATMPAEIDIPSTGLTDYMVQNLTPNTTYYFAISSYNSQGVESNYSAVVSVTTS
jgi:hypothetical protein